MKVKCDHRSKFSNLSNWKEEAWKKKKPVSRRSRVRIPLKPWFFQASSFQLLKLENLLRWSHFTFIKKFNWKRFDCQSENLVAFLLKLLMRPNIIFFKIVGFHKKRKQCSGPPECPANKGYSNTKIQRGEFILLIQKYLNFRHLHFWKVMVALNP